MRSKFQPLKPLFEFLKPYFPAYLFGVLGVAFASMFLNICLSHMLLEFTRGAMALSSEKIIGSVVGMTIVTVALTILLFFAIRKLLDSVMLFLGDLRDAYFHRVLDMPVAELDKRHSGDIISRAASDTWLARSVFIQGFQNLANALLGGIGCGIYMIVLNPKLGLMCIGVCALPLLGNLPFVTPLREIGMKLQQEKAQLTAAFSDLIQGSEVVRTFSISETMSAKVRHSAEQVKKVGVGQSWIEAARSAAERISGLGDLIFIVYAAHQAILNPLLVPIVIAFVQLINPVKYMFSAVGGTLAGIQGNLAAAERVLEIIDIPSEPEKYGPICGDFFEDEEDESKAARFESKEPEHVEREYAVVVENLSFRYPGSDEYVLKEVSFTVPKGETLAIVGPSGSGKTTIFKLLLGLYPPTSGDIIVEGRSIFETDLEEWRQKFSYVPQDAFLFSGSVLDNVKSPDSDNTGELDEVEQEVREALSMARADVFVDELPDGILTPVGERGARLSGGQRQRIAIARAIAKDAPILLLDEATASLDNESERFIQESLEELMGEHTCLVIAHRLSTIEKADKIIYLENGSIVEEGTHEELTGNPDSKYRMLVERNLFLA